MASEIEAQVFGAVIWALPLAANSKSTVIVCPSVRRTCIVYSPLKLRSAKATTHGGPEIQKETN
jgi:hypothetical protein